MTDDTDDPDINSAAEEPWFRSRSGWFIDDEREAHAHKPGYWLLTFISQRFNGKPPYGFRGAVVVLADSANDAVNKCFELQLYPGGNMMANFMEYVPDPKWCNRVLSAELVTEMDSEYLEQKARTEDRLKS
jgi:hypothetical protein